MHGDGRFLAMSSRASVRITLPTRTRQAQEDQIQQLKEHIINLNQQLAASAAQNAAQREQINFLQSLVTSAIPARTQPPPT